jgi:cyanate lyase
MKRADLTEKILDIKREKGWSWKYICDGDRRHVADARRGRAARPDEAGEAAGRQGRRALRPQRGRAAMLNEVPYRGTPCRRPTR